MPKGLSPFCCGHGRENMEDSATHRDGRGNSTFRAFPIDAEGRIEGPPVDVAACDANEALEQASRLLHGPVELWMGARLIATARPPRKAG